MMSLMFMFSVVVTLTNAFTMKHFGNQLTTRAYARSATEYVDSLVNPSKLPKQTILNGTLSKSRFEINELVLQLEKVNPTSDPAESDLINGVWELIVTGVSDPFLWIYQALKLIPSGIRSNIIDASSLTLTISPTQPRVKASSTINVATIKTNVQVVTELEATSSVRLKETYKSGKIGPIEIPLSAIPYLHRELVVSYLDKDMLIVRDILGSPGILKRVADLESEI